MFLTKFPINVTRRETHAMLTSPYRMHAAIAGSFAPLETKRGEGRILWRVDKDLQGHAVLYLVSPQRPSLVGLDEQIGWPDLEPQWQTRDYDEVLDRIKEGRTYGFRLVANPVVARSEVKGKGGRSKRLPHVTALQQASWLIGKAAYEDAGVEPPDFIRVQEDTRANRNGFSIMRDETSGMHKLVVSDSRMWTLRKTGADKPIRLATARFDGVLRVDDATRLRHALVCGIGHAKGFGCGLLTLAPVEAS